MSSVPKPPPRFLPTLTEVVAAVAQEPAKAPETGVPQPDAEAIIWRVMQEIGPTLEARFREVVSTVVSEQIRLIEPRLMQEVEQAVEQAVAKAVVLELDALQHNSGH